MIKNIDNEFHKFAHKHFGISGLNLDYWDKFRNSNLDIYKISASMTPMILEEREMRVTQMSVFDRLMMDRIIHLIGGVDDHMSSITQAQLIFLDNLETKDITHHISSPGGSVLSGLGIIDVMNYISSDISTVNMGLCASMASVLLAAGTPKKRFSLKHSRVMLHTVSSGAEGKVQDMKISLKEAEKYNDILFNLLSEYTKQDKEKILKDADRDLWFNAEEAKEYGLIDDIILTKKKLKK